jgi:L-2-hydroxyglutarate oxidase
VSGAGARCDVAVVGGGVVGLAVAREIGLRRPGARVVVLEKEDGIARHQTGRNSGVVHSGLYYKPGSLKARTCRLGRALLLDYCRSRGVPHEICSKVVVAVSAEELPALGRIAERARANDVRCEPLDAAGLRREEPEAAGVAALRVPETGIVDYVAFCRALAEDVRTAGGEVRTGVRFLGAAPRGDAVVVRTDAGEFPAGGLINCAGLHSDRAALATGDARPARIVPFRGEYFELRPEARGLVRNLIYPVPDPNFPFLGVHFTRLVSGGVECGPNAVLAFKREGYRRTDFSAGDVFDYATYGGFWRLVGRHWRAGLGEMRRSWSKDAFVRALARLLPAIRAEHLEPAEAGVRAQALARDGALVDDFLVAAAPRRVHVLNAPSPAATASLAIARLVADEAERAGALPEETPR